MSLLAFQPYFPAPAPSGGISFVGYASVQGLLISSPLSLSLTALSAGTLQPGDLVVVSAAVGANTNRSPSFATAGYSGPAALFANDTQDTSLLVGWKVMGATPDTDVAVGYTTSSDSTVSIIARVYRGVDAVTPMDVAEVTRTQTNTALPNPLAITPVTAGAKIIVAASCGHNLGAQTLSDAALFSAVAMNPSGGAHHHSHTSGDLDWAGGAFDPAVMTWTGVDANTFSAASVVLALRPA